MGVRVRIVRMSIRDVNRGRGMVRKRESVR